MRSFRASIAVAAVLGLSVLVAWAETGETLTIANAPPVVIATVPVSGSTGVDPNLKEIRVTFSKPMMDKNWSWSQTSAAAFPQVDGDIHYDKDGRTCVLQVKLEPGTTYASWLNSQKFGNFKDQDGRSAVPYLLIFETKAAK